MTSIRIDDQTGSLAVRDILAHPPGEVIEFLGSSGEVLGTLFIQGRAPTEDAYADVVASAEADLDKLLRLANTPRSECATTAEVLARARAHAPD